LDYNKFKFNKQFVNYMQILDTDYTGVLTIYHCEESRKYKNKKTGKELSHEDAWDFVKNKEMRVKVEKQQIYSYEWENDIEWKDVSKEEVFMLYRPIKIDEEV